MAPDHLWRLLELLPSNASKIDYNVVRPLISEGDDGFIVVDTPPPGRKEPETSAREEDEGEDHNEGQTSRRKSRVAHGSAAQENTMETIAHEAVMAGLDVQKNDVRVEDTLPVKEATSPDIALDSTPDSQVNIQKKQQSQGIVPEIDPRPLAHNPTDTSHAEQVESQRARDDLVQNALSVVLDANTEERTTSNVNDNDGQLHVPETLHEDTTGARKDIERGFAYQALSAESHFRLLTIYPARILDSDSVVICSLEEYNIDSIDCPPYTAVSYTWGTDEPNYGIRIGNDHGTANGSKQPNFFVRSNLDNVLRRLRDHEHPRRVWIDAICINQDSIVERNKQVPLMGKIYAQSNYAVAWLNSKHAYEAHGSTVAAFNLIRNGTHFRLDENRTYYTGKEYIPEWQHEWHCLAELCKRTYWSRKWIIQEVIMAPTVWLQSGECDLPMTKMEEFFGRFGNPFGHPDDDSADSSERERAKEWESLFGSLNLTETSAARIALHRLAKRQGVDVPSSLHELIPRYSKSVCSVPADHVYALYNLIGDHRDELMVNYAQDSLQRLRGVLEFTHRYEDLPPVDSISYTALLLKHLDLSLESVFEREHWGDVHLLATAFDLGAAQRAEESEGSRAARRREKPLKQTRFFPLTSINNIWTTQGSSPTRLAMTTVPPQDLVHFDAKDVKLSGMATNRIEAGDRVWYFNEMPLALIVRMRDDGNAHVVGRAHLFVKPYPGRRELFYEPRPVKRPFALDSDEAERRAREISLPMGQFVMLAAWAGMLL